MRRESGLIRFGLRRGEEERTLFPMTIISSVASSICNTVQVTSTANGPGKNNGLSIVCPASGGHFSQRSNNNKKSTSQSFQATNQFVVNTDNYWDANIDQASWTSYGEDIEGQWDMCVSCALATSPKKLYRQVAIYRQLLGLGQINLPLPGMSYADTVVGQSTLFTDPNHSIPDRIQIAGTAGTKDSIYTVNIGKGLKNPVIRISPEDIDASLFDGSVFDAVYAMITASVAEPAPGAVGGFASTVCSFLEDGSPGHSVIVTPALVWQNIGF